jgi:hypothetical protein
MLLRNAYGQEMIDVEANSGCSLVQCQSAALGPQHSQRLQIDSHAADLCALELGLWREIATTKVGVARTRILHKWEPLPGCTAYPLRRVRRVNRGRLPSA